MSSTDAKEQRLRRFFSETMAPLAERLRAGGTRFFTTGPDEGDDASWYVDYPADTPELVAFESAEIERQLTELWKTQGHDDLLPLAAPLAELARELEMPLPTDDADVSPFIYVMF